MKVVVVLLCALFCFGGLKVLFASLLLLFFCVGEGEDGPCRPGSKGGVDLL